MLTRWSAPREKIVMLCVAGVRLARSFRVRIITFIAYYYYYLLVFGART